MKKLLCLLWVMVLLLGLAGCEEQAAKEETQATTQLEEGCVRYEFVQWSIDTEVQTYEMVSTVTGNKDLYLKLFDDGTAKMSIGTDVNEMQYEGETIWLVSEPNNKMKLTVVANVATVTDGAYVFQFVQRIPE